MPDRTNDTGFAMMRSGAVAMPMAGWVPLIPCCTPSLCVAISASATSRARHAGGMSTPLRASRLTTPQTMF
jgi:hypothetical protein